MILLYDLVFHAIQLLNMTDVLIICALRDEYNALLKTLGGETSWKEEVIDGWTVAKATIASASGTLSLMATWQNFMGREQAIAATTSLLQQEKNRIKCICMTGICAGRRGKVHLGDVIFADRLWSYDAGKSVVIGGVESFQGDQLQFRPNPKILQRMQSFKLEEEKWLEFRPKYSLDYQERWLILQLLDGNQPSNNEMFKTYCFGFSEVIKRLRKRNWITPQGFNLTDAGLKEATKLKEEYLFGLPDDPVFSLHIAPMATGSTVKEDDNIFNYLADRDMRKVLGIDMEASGLAALGEILDIPVIISKAVSDYGDTFKDDSYRHFASRAAAECLIKLLVNCSDLILDTQETNNLISKDSLSSQTYLINELSNLYYDVNSIRNLWVRSGGKLSDISNISNISDLWFELICKATNGSNVTINDLIKNTLIDFPKNQSLQQYL
ncbi:effector-associated domain EAD1-containing protein [Acinetobacter baumannii]|uniref:phosphorylase family protein n=2 Tax=Acinetobacter baumannii TaxID=470 RepID=UPI0010CD68EA|nr:effector-associated domain EAD1-containing protein [Acinetobacter baumannii]MCT6572667.1 effector-associated domain EAD1-containing protein [Acinetobacter baumannii]MCT6575714.1 effector-associated domain EAD1-containing protein [Acinetobacter baumannii]MCT6598711.1 effector-associated domain EAD1-containing protein [Acinetobacter baumannii]MCT6602382.1 effector-associated domain EAD1-containing protein [Acinetobacter baumannii]MCT6606448.1 effector-associated domain EAD1-containing protein